jgi:hypothetical protein
VQRVSLKSIGVNGAADTSCTAHWVNANNSNDCRVQVDLHVPTDCNKSIECDTQIFVTSAGLPLPALAVRADLDRSDGHTLNQFHNYPIGGPCDPGFHHPASPPTPTVISGNAGQSCSASWRNAGDPNDCTVDVTYSLGDLTKSIRCDTQVVEAANVPPPPPPIGCP